MQVHARRGALQRWEESKAIRQETEVQSCAKVRQLLQVAGESIQLNGRIRRSLVLDAFPRQPQLGFVQESSSFPNIFIASASESDALSHFF
jgi:hypothetical protein